MLRTMHFRLRLQALHAIAQPASDAAYSPGLNTLESRPIYIYRETQGVSTGSRTLNGKPNIFVGAFDLPKYRDLPCISGYIRPDTWLQGLPRPFLPAESNGFFRFSVSLPVRSEFRVTFMIEDL